MRDVRVSYRENWQTEGPVVTAIRHQLGVVSGKTHTVQFAFGGLGVNPHWGPPRNPWDAQDHRSPGGSSSGAGVSLHEGSALLAIGTDTAGVGAHACHHDRQCRVPANAGTLVDGWDRTAGQIPRHRWSVGQKRR